MSGLIPFFLLFPLATAVTSLLLYQAPALQQVVSAIGTLALFVVAALAIVAVGEAGPIAMGIGGWPAPYGIVLVVDHASAPLILMTSIVGLLGSLYAAVGIDRERQRAGFFPLLHLMLLAVVGAFLTSDLFNLFVWFELMLMSSFVLLVLGGDRAQLEGAVKYVVLSVIASMLLLVAVGLVYRTTGTLNLADLAGKLPEVQERSLVRVSAMLLIAAFGIKAAAFPLYFWLPASYHTPPVAVTAIFSALLTKVGIYAMLRVLPLLYAAEAEPIRWILLGSAVFTMLTGVLGAVAEQDIRRLLSFHIISQIGYMLLGVGLFTASGFSAALFFILHIMVAKTALFWLSGAMEQVQGSFHLSQLGGLAQRRPALALMFFVPAMSLAGIPPLSGFVAKLSVVQAGLAEERYLVVGVALVVSLLTLLSMTKIWLLAFWYPPPEETPDRPLGAEGALSLLVPTAAFGLLALALGVVAGPVYAWLDVAGEQLMNPELYIEAVLGASR